METILFTYNNSHISSKISLSFMEVEPRDTVIH